MSVAIPIIERVSPNVDARPERQAVDILLLHYTGMQSAEAAIDRLCDPTAQVSAHYVVTEDGAIVSLVPERLRAWHAGKAYWRGDRDINARSIGIEIVNPGHDWGYRPFPPAQMRALAHLCLGILGRHPIPPERVLAHSDVAPTRKQDPGELFDWTCLARHGIGRMPMFGGVARTSRLGAPALLDAIGYETDPDGSLGQLTTAAIAAFQRRYRPARIDGAADAQTLSLLAAVAGA